MGKEKRSKKQLQGKSHKMCARLDHIFENGKGKCIVCGLIDRSQIETQVLTRSQEERLAKHLGVKLRDESKGREKFNDEVTLPPHLQAVWNYAINYANAASMYEQGVIKASNNMKKQFAADKVVLRIDNETGKIVKITPVEKEEEETK